MSDELNAILNGEPVKEPEADPKPAEQQAEAEAEGDDPEPVKGETPSEEGSQDAPPASEESNDKTVPLSALQAERTKRQETERRLQELEARDTQPAPPDPATDPQGAHDQLQASVQQSIFNERLNMSETMARQALGDEAVDQATEMFKAAVEKNPALRQQLEAEQHPYGWLVNWAKREQAFADIGDPDAWKEKVRGEIEAKFKADIEALEAAQRDDAKRAQNPQSLAGETNTGQGRTATYAGPAPLGELIDG